MKTQDVKYVRRMRAPLPVKPCKRSQRDAALRETVADLELACKALREQSHFFQTLIDTIPNPVFYKDLSNRYLGCNRAFEKRLGLTKEKILGKYAFDLFPRDLAEKYHRMDQELLENPGEQSYEDILLYADGRLHDVIIKKATFSDVDGRLAGLVGVTVDITDRKRAEKALKHTNDDLETLVEKRTAQLTEANRELRSEIAERERVEKDLQESSEKLKLFAYSVVHDLKSPTVGVVGLTKLLQKQHGSQLDEKGRRYCELISRAAEHLATLVEEINIYMSAKELPLTIEVVDSEEILREIQAEFAPVMESRGIKWEEPDSPPKVKADRMAILRIFRNFVDNALKYSGACLTRIAVEYEETEQFHIFSVSDDGMGIKAENPEDVFKPFQRSAKAKDIQGTGLGLAIVREIAERHRGKVWTKPGSKRGATFSFSISKAL